MHVRIEMISLPVNNLEQAVEWYERLGYSAEYDGADNQRARVTVGNGQWIQLVRTGRQTNMNFFNDEGYEMYPCTIRTADVHGMHRRLASSGWDAGECLDECGYNFKAYDPDGNRLHLWGGFIGFENPAADGIETVYIPVADLKSSSDWYIKYFGAVLERPGQYQFHLLPSGQTLMLIEIKDGKRLRIEAELQKEQYGVSLAVTDFSGLMRALKNGGQPIVEVREGEEARQRMIIADPSGNAIRISEEIGDLRIASEETDLCLQQG
ncbi:MAG: VOC family protein [Cohnella sp.]|nr:VOC family protein [Cohnella sp.]